MDQKDMCYNDIGLCAPNVLNCFQSNNVHNWEGLHDHLKRKRIFTLASYNNCISTLILKVKPDMIHNC